MIKTVRYFIGVAVLIILLFLAGSAKYSLAFSPPRSGFGTAEISGPITLSVSTNPAVIQPGDEFELSILLVNTTRSTYSPAIQFNLPNTVQLQSTALPSGMTINYQTGHLDWLPVLSGNNGRIEHTLKFKAGSAHILQPEQAIRINMSINNQQLTVDSRFWLGTAPTVDGIVLPNQVAIGQPVQLRADVSGSGPITQRWELGDGRQVDVNNPEVVFSEAGLYEITLTAVNPLSTHSKKRTIRVVPQPAAQFTLSDFTVGQNQAVEFVNQSGGRGPLQTIWEFGDGTTSSETNPKHAYNAPGIYQIHLTVINQYGRSEAYGSVTVGGAPAVNIQVPESVSAGDPLQMQAVGDESVTRYQWDFGDGRLVEGAQIAPTFNFSGDYYITLTAFNEYGQTSTGQWINVRPGTLRSFLPLIFKSPQTEGTVVSIARPVEQGGAGEGLPDVPLDQPFVMTPLELPVSMSMTDQLIVYVNEARRQFGLRPLVQTPTLTAAAQAHALDMAKFKYTGHVGSDGSAPIERFVQYQYSGGYAGEATAWGFEHPYQAVEFWVNSPGHRKIILNENATDLGVGYTVDYRAPSVWYWTTEYGNRFATPYSPTIRPQKPLAEAQFVNTDIVEYGWVWPAPLTANQSFAVYASVAGKEFLVGQVSEPRYGIYYAVSANLLAITEDAGAVSWRVALQSGNQAIVQSDPLAIVIAPDPALPTVTPTAVPTQIPATIQPTATETPFIPTPTSPAVNAPPPLATATPSP